MAEENQLEKMNKYFPAAVAGKVFKDPSRGHYALELFYKYWENRLGVEDAREDSILQEAFNRARVGLSQGQITDSGVFRSMGLYNDKFNRAMTSSTVGELLNFYGEGNIKERTNNILQQYLDKKIGEIEDENHKKVIATVFASLKEKKEENFFVEVVNRTVNSNLQGLERLLEGNQEE